MSPLVPDLLELVGAIDLPNIGSTAEELVDTRVYPRIIPQVMDPRPEVDLIRSISQATLHAI